MPGPVLIFLFLSIHDRICLFQQLHNSNPVMILAHFNDVHTYH